MRYSAARLGFAALIALTLGAKVVASRAAPGPDPVAAATAAAAVLTRAGFEARLLRTPRSPGVLVAASLGECRLLAGDYPPHGTFAAVYRDLAAPLGPLRYAYRGKLGSRVPKLAALTQFYRWRELRRIGVSARRAPVIAIAAGGTCDLARVDWSGTAFVSR